MNQKFLADSGIGRRVLITGGAGFIGSHLAERLLDSGCQVTALDDLSTGSEGNVAHLARRPGFHLEVGSIADTSLLDCLVAQSDTVFHLAAAVGVTRIVDDPLGSLQTNILGSHNLLAAAEKGHKKVLLASTSEVYGKGTRIPFHEDDDRLMGPTTIARWSYANAKATDEFLALAYYQQRQLPVVIFRLFNTVGPRQTGQYGMVLPRFVQQALAGGPLTVYGDGQQSRCFCDVNDVVAAIISLAQHPGAVGQVFNVGSTSEITILALAHKVLRLVQESKSDHNGSTEAENIVLVPYTEAYGPGFEDMQRRVPAISKIRALTGWQPHTSLDATIRRVIRQQIEPAVEAYTP